MKKTPQTQAQIDAAFIANGGMPKSHVDKPKHPGGRPSNYPKINLDDVKKWAKIGLSNDQIAQALEISIESLYDYQRDYPEFLQALKSGKENPDDRVERALFERALGYVAPEEKLFYDSNTGIIASQTVLKQYPPDTTAAIIWLKNRRPEKWRENPAPETPATENNINITFVPVPKK